MINTRAAHITNCNISEVAAKRSARSICAGGNYRTLIYPAEELGCNGWRHAVHFDHFRDVGEIIV